MESKAEQLSIDSLFEYEPTTVQSVETASVSLVSNKKVPYFPKQLSFDQFSEDGWKTFDEVDLKEKFLKNMDWLKSMSVEEHTFYKKWLEIKSYSHLMSKAEEVKAKIWRPIDIFNKETTLKELNDIKPKIKYVDPTNESDMSDWLLLRVFCHTMSYEQSPGRFIRFLVYVENDSGTVKYLGAASISNDVMALTCRDKFIGWTSKNRIEDKTLIHSAIGSCIMGTQPFGYNFLGGKLVACLILSSHVRETWEKIVEKKLVGMTTTSLYGPNSMYCGIPYWEGCGCSAGKISIKPDDYLYDAWHDYIKQHRTAEYMKKTMKEDQDSGPVTGVKQRILEIIFREMGIPASKYNHGFERGVYYSCFYDETKDVLTNKLTDLSNLTLKKRFQSDDVGMIEWWRKKAINRYTKLHTENRLKPEVLFYNKMIDMTYDQAKNVYLTEVGR